MKQIGNRTLQLQQKNALQNRISQVMQEMPHPSQHGRTQGMDFIDVRREIQNELRAVGSTGIVKTKVSKKLINQGDCGNEWIDSTLNLQTSKSQKQDFSQLRQQIHTTSLSVHQHPPEKKRVFGNLSMIKNENMLCKREKIRKFMKEKARLMQNKAEQQRLSELKTFKKVRCNLKQLNEFVQSKMGQSSGITTPALKVKRPQIKKQTVAQENEERPKKGQNIQDRNITPQRTGLFEQSDVSLNISAKRAQSRSALGQQNQKDIQKLHDTLYEDSRLSSIDAHDERSAKRNQVNKVLSVCFEKSASQKALRKSFRQQHSPQILKQRGGQQKSRPQSALSLQGNKINNSSKQRKAKSAPKRQKSGCTRRFILPAQGKVSGIHLNTDEQFENDENKDVTLNLKLTDQAAAVVIQKEVRKFLANLGFYEARKVNQNGESQQSPRLQSPDRNNVIDLYIRPKSNSSKRSSPLIQNSRKKGSTSGKRDKSPDYELLDPSQSNSNFKVKISPQQLKNILRQELNDPNYQIQPAKQTMTEFKKIEPSEPSLFDKLPSHSNQSLLSAERKRASEDVKRPVSLINRIKNGVNNKSSAAISQVPALWGLHSVSTPLSDQTGQNQDANQVLDVVSQSSSMFDRNSFQQFSQQRLTNLMRNNEYQKLIHFREECLIFRERKEKKHIQKLLQDNQMTPKTYKQRQQQIERWVSLQRLEIEQTKLGFKEEWEKTVQMVEDTQKNVDQLKIKMNSARNADSNSYSQASSRHNSKPPRQILIDEAPKSYRSGRHEPHQVKISDLDPSLGQLTSRDSQKIEDLINNQLYNQKPQSEKSDQKISDHKQIISPGHQKSSSGGDLDNLIQPSVAFINRLEKAAHGLLPRDSSNEGTLNIEEHDYLDDFGDDGKNIPQQTDTFDNFKNRIMQMKDLNQLFSGESQGNSDAQSDHKSEPMVESADNGKEEVKISDMLNKRADLKQSLNYQEEIIAPIVPQPELNVLHSQMADQITDALMQQLLKDCLQVPKRSKEKVQPPQLPDQDVYTVDSYSIDREEKKEWIEIRQRHVIEANLIRCDQYVNELVDVLLQFDISDISENSDFDYEVKPNDNFHIQFLKLLTQPIQRPPSETLELMQKSELGSYQHFETTLDASKHPIVSVDLYLEIEKAREESMLARKSTADARKLQIWESIHIYNKCIFDSVNESLMKFRPYGIVGQPMPWSNKVRRLQTKVEIASVDTERLFQMVKQEIFRWSQVFCGCLPGPVFYFPNPRTGKDEFQEDLFQEVRERRLTSVLTQDTVEQEHHWLNYEFEETQVKVDLSDMILEVLVGEVISLLRNQEQ